MAFTEGIRSPASTWYHRCVVLRLSKLITFVAFSLGLSPNLVTFLSTLMAVIGMLIIILAPDSLFAGLVSLLFLQLCFATDSADGQLARLQGTSTKFGNFFDICLDGFNHFIVFGGYGIAWGMAYSGRLSLLSIVLYVFGASAYTLYFFTSAIRGYVFPELGGTMQRLGGNWKKNILKIPYALINRGFHYLALSCAYILGLIYPIVVAYGILSMILTVAMIVYVYLWEKNRV